MESPAWFEVTDQNQCDHAFEELKRSYEKWQSFLSLLGHGRTFEMYHERIAKIYHSSVWNISDIVEHAECVLHEEQSTEILQSLILVVQLGKNITQSESFEEALGYALQVAPATIPILGLTTEGIEELNDDIIRDCSWLSIGAKETQASKRHVASDLARANEETKTAARHFVFLAESYKKIHDHVKHLIFPSLELGFDYLNQKTSKLNLSRTISQKKYTRALLDLEETEELMDTMARYAEAMVIAREKIGHAYGTVFTLKLPILHRGNIRELELVKAAEKINASNVQVKFYSAPFVSWVHKALPPNAADAVFLVRGQW